MKINIYFHKSFYIFFYVYFSSTFLIYLFICFILFHYFFFVDDKMTSFSHPCQGKWWPHFTRHVYVRVYPVQLGQWLALTNAPFSPLLMTKDHCITLTFTLLLLSIFFHHQKIKRNEFLFFFYLLLLHYLFRGSLCAGDKIQIVPRATIDWLNINYFFFFVYIYLLKL